MDLCIVGIIAKSVLCKLCQETECIVVFFANMLSASANMGNLACT
jgi:hypothetical protein